MNAKIIWNTPPVWNKANIKTDNKNATFSLNIFLSLSNIIPLNNNSYITGPKIPVPITIVNVTNPLLTLIFRKFLINSIIKFRPIDNITEKIIIFINWISTCMPGRGKCRFQHSSKALLIIGKERKKGQNQENGSF